MELLHEKPSNDLKEKLCRLIREDLRKIRDYDEAIAMIGENRKSMSKTESDATFIRMKKKAMKNGQLKPSYNLQYASDSNYIIDCTISCDRTDYETSIPLPTYARIDDINFSIKMYAEEAES